MTIRGLHVVRDGRVDGSILRISLAFTVSSLSRKHR
jgi:hypothetical protein